MESLMDELRFAQSEQIRQAALYFDQNYPGWFYNVNLAKLDMNSCTKCIIGQVFGLDSSHSGRWSEFMGKIFTSREEIGWVDNPMGFPSFVFSSESYAPFWVNEIKQRLNLAEAISNSNNQTQIESSSHYVDNLVKSNG